MNIWMILFFVCYVWAGLTTVASILLFENIGRKIGNKPKNETSGNYLAIFIIVIIWPFTLIIWTIEAFKEL